MERNSGIYGIPKNEISTLRLDGAAGIQGVNNAVYFNMPPTYQYGSAFTIVNDTVVDGGKIYLNQAGIYTVGYTTLDIGGANNPILYIFKPSGDNIPDNGNIGPGYEILIDSGQIAAGKNFCGHQTFRAEKGWYLQFLNTDGSHNQSTFFTIVTKIA